MAKFGRFVEHPVAAKFPMMEPAELEALARNIVERGQSNPCIVYGDWLVDGRNRWRACELAGVEPVVVAREFASEEALAGWVIAENLHRRHLSVSQRAMIAADLEPSFAGTPGTRARDIAGQAMGVSGSSVKHAKVVMAAGTPELQSMVRANLVTVRAAADVARLPPEAQSSIVRQGPEAVTEAAVATRDLREAYAPHLGYGFVPPPSAQPRQRDVARDTCATVEWYTPGPITVSARKVMGRIDLDPASCAEANATVGADRYYTEADNGLVQPWSGCVWLNMPYGKDAKGRSNQGVWSRHAIELYEAGTIEQACILVNAKIGERWFNRFWPFPFCLFDARVRFIAPGGEPGEQPRHGTAVIYLGPNVIAFRDEFRRYGRIVLPDPECMPR